MKRVLSLFLTVALLLSAAALPALAEDVKTINVMVWCRDTDNLNFDTMDFFDKITEETGVRAKFTKVMGSDWDTKVNLMLTSGEYPDIILRGNVSAEMYGVDQGILLPLDQYIDEYMPIYKALLDADASLAGQLRASDGKSYYTGWIVPQNINVAGHLFVNHVWLENAGIAKAPTTVEEFEAMLRAFKDQDVNGNGDANDEIPFTAMLLADQQGIVNLANFWGVPSNPRFIHVGENNQVRSYLMDDNYRAALETISKWYTDGLIDIESVSQDTNAFEAKVCSGNVGSFWRWRMTNMGSPDNVNEQYTCILPVSANGIQPQVYQLLETVGFGAAITTACKDIEAACKWLDAQYEFENQLTSYHGNDTWYIDEATGKYVVKPTNNTDNINTPGQSSLHYVPGAMYFEKAEMVPHRIEKIEYCQLYTQAGVVEPISYQTVATLSKRTLEEEEEMTLLYAELKKYVEEATVDFISRGVTDEKWNQYVKNLENLRLARYLEIYQLAYDRYLTVN